ncbi:hypothetical protein [Prescottella subtropica]|uniref:hypothetical protein n=1 Tax=Prescottella subtropica TaxID=2545757 RepID=UPI0010F639B1|nr:hypothetical protein [Prescottella subtropica]
MRALRILLSCFGFVTGLLVNACLLLESVWMDEPTRTTFSSIDDSTYGSTVSCALDPWSAAILLAVPVVGAVLGWLVGALAGRTGWALTRTKS